MVSQKCTDCSIMRNTSLSPISYITFCFVAVPARARGHSLVSHIICNRPVSTGGEIQLADAINAQATNNAVEAVILNGRRFDGGSVQGYLDAIIHLAGYKEH